jgi:hypothetical protein
MDDDLNRLEAVTDELERLLEACPGLETAAYGPWARRCVSLGFARLELCNSLKTVLGGA